MKLDYHHLKSVDSTNSWAKRQSDTFGRDALTVVTAEGQTGGRGRFNRQWISPFGKNIYASFCFFLPTSRRDVVNTAQVLSLSCAKTLRRMHYDVWLKWPNDLLIDGKKLGGVLCETVLSQGDACVIAGVGLNVNMGAEIMEQISVPATSLMLERGHPQPLDAVIGHIIAGVTADLTAFIQQGFPPFIDEYKKYLVHRRGDLLHIHNGSQKINGTFVHIDDEGHLCLQSDDGIKTVLAGELTGG